METSSFSSPTRLERVMQINTNDPGDPTCASKARRKFSLGVNARFVFRQSLIFFFFFLFWAFSLIELSSKLDFVVS